MLNRFALAIASSLVLSILASPTFAQDWLKRAFGRKEPKPPVAKVPELEKKRDYWDREEAKQIENPYPLKPEHGRVVIVVATYVNYEGIVPAIKLANDLRKRHNIPAYIMEHKEENDLYKPTDKQVEQWKEQFMGRAPRVPKYLNPPVPHYAVVVAGGFETIEDDAKVDAALAKINSLKPKDFSEDVVFELRWINNKLSRVRPVLNPLRPKDEFLDVALIEQLKLLKSLNEGEPYSVYKNTGTLTIRVALFKGFSGVIKEDAETRGLFNMNKKSNGLEIAKNNAHTLCDVMRKAGYEAYVFHGTTASCVTVGSYQGKDDPRLLKDFETLAKTKFSEFELQPSIMNVPKHPDVKLMNAN